jgi:hypothetical protein
MLCTKAVKPAPGLAQTLEHGLDLRVVGHVAVEHQCRVELGGELGDAVLEALTDVAEGQLGALRVAGLGDAVGDGAVGQNARDEQLLAGQKTHCCSPGECGEMAAPWRGEIPAACLGAPPA